MNQQHGQGLFAQSGTDPATHKHFEQVEDPSEIDKGLRPLYKLYDVTYTPEEPQEVTASDVVPVWEALEPIKNGGVTRTRLYKSLVECFYLSLSGQEDELRSLFEDLANRTTLGPVEVKKYLMEAIGETMDLMMTHRAEPFGALATSANATNSDTGQNWTPHTVAQLLSSLVHDATPPAQQTDWADIETQEENDFDRIADPAGGTARLLTSTVRTKPMGRYRVIELQPTEAKAAAVNLALFGVSGVVQHGDSLRDAFHSTWEIRGVNYPALAEGLGLSVPEGPTTVQQMRAIPRPTPYLAAISSELSGGLIRPIDEDP